LFGSLFVCQHKQRKKGKKKAWQSISSMRVKCILFPKAILKFLLIIKDILWNTSDLLVRLDVLIVNYVDALSSIDLLIKSHNIT
jgi:hypothetical protein